MIFYLQRLYEAFNGITNLVGDTLTASFPGFDKIKEKVKEGFEKRIKIISRRVKRENRLRGLYGEE